MSKAKRRVDIPRVIAAEVLFLSDRTCCVCRKRGRPIQIHHIDDDPANNSPQNLAVLCLDCHNETLLAGGFHRKLDGDQIRLYRDNWHRVVSQTRAVEEAERVSQIKDAGERLRLSESVAEAYRDNQQWDLLAIHYDLMGNVDLRDKYVELSLKENPSDEALVYWRARQGRTKDIPPEVIARQEKDLTERKDFSQRARFYHSIGEPGKAALDYVTSVLEDLQAGNAFAAAFYLKEMQEEGIIKYLFIQALETAKSRGDLHWQIRALEELGWDTELMQLVLDHKDEIETSGDSKQRLLLAKAEGDMAKARAIRVQMAKTEM